MLRKIGKRVVWVTAGVITLTLTVGVLAARRQGQGATVAEIMEEGHSGKKSLLRKIGDAVDDSKVAAVEKEAKRLKELGEALGKNKQPKGSDASWKKLTEQYKKETAALAEAVGKKDQKKAEEARGEVEEVVPGVPRRTQGRVTPIRNRLAADPTGPPFAFQLGLPPLRVNCVSSAVWPGSPAPKEGALMAEEAKKKGGFIKTILGAMIGLASGVGAMYATAIVDRVAKPPKPVANFAISQTA